MPTLANFNGASLVPNIADAVRDDLQGFQDRKREETAKNTLTDQLRVALGGQSQAPQSNTNTGGMGILSQIAPDIAAAAGKIFGNRNPEETNAFREEASQGIALANEISQLPDFAARQRRITEEVSNVVAAGGDVSRLVELSNMDEAHLDLELQRMGVIGEGMLDAVPEVRPDDVFKVFSTPERREALTQIMATNPQLGSMLLSQRDKQLAAEERRRAAAASASRAQAAAAAAAAEPKTELGQELAGIRADIASGAITPEAGGLMIDNARAAATTPENQPLENVLDAEGNIVAQRNPETGAFSAVPEGMTPSAPLVDVLDAEGNIVAQRNPETGALSSVPSNMLPPEPSSPEAVAINDFNNGFLSQENLDTILDTPEEFRTDVGKLLADRKLAIEMFGEDSEQVQMFTDAVDSFSEDAPNLSDVSSMRKEYARLSADFIVMRDAMGKIEQAATNPSPAGDLSLIFNYMKILDPNSVVRESEFATAANSGSVPSRVTAQYNRVLNGERLSIEMREDFVDTANRLFQSQLVSQQLLSDNYTGIAERAGVDPTDVVVDFVGDIDVNKIPSASFAANVSERAKNSGLTVQEVWDASTPEERKSIEAGK